MGGRARRSHADLALSGVSPKTLLRWLVEEPGLWDAVGIHNRGQRWIQTAAFRKWMAGELVLGTAVEEAPGNVTPLAEKRSGAG